MQPWAPEYLVRIYEDIVSFEEETKKRNPSAIEKKQLAESKQFSSWDQYISYIDHYKKIIYSLCNDDNARSVWEWIGEIDIVYPWNSISLVIEDWYRSPRQTNKEFNDDRDEIVDLAKRLSIKLSKHYGNPNIPTNLSAFIPDEYTEKALKTTHPEFIKIAEKKKRNPKMYIGLGLPPIHVILNSLANLVSQAEPRKGPRKIHSKSALRQKLLGRVVESLYGNGARHSMENLVKFLYLLTGDETITDATIRADLNSSDYWEYYRPQDF